MSLFPIPRGARLAASVLALAAALPAAARPARAELRPPTPAESRALRRILGAVQQVLDRLGSDDWEKTSDLYDGEPLVNSAPDVPLDINQNFERVYRVRRGSHRYSTRLWPLMERLEQVPDLAGKQQVGAEIQRLSWVTADVHINMRSAPIGQPPARNRDLGVAGAAFAYALNPGDSPDAGHGSYFILGFGNWRGARWDGENLGYRFAFAHRPGTPFVENVVIRIWGADDRIRELLRAVDWNQLNAALTR
ncbi:MAG TPA: hypothetical protein VMS93_00195 [Candidatus Saccharimonadales bacterium]|nr:hypothetical protein [Candidatus Saccharimonadales bacterium]